jgi:hypothetical protein
MAGYSVTEGATLQTLRDIHPARAIYLSAWRYVSCQGVQLPDAQDPA